MRLIRPIAVFISLMGFIGLISLIIVIALKPKSSLPQTSSPSPVLITTAGLQTTISQNTQNQPQIQLVTQAFGKTTEKTTMTMETTDAQNQPIAQNNQTTYPNISPHTDVIYKTLKNGIKEEIVLHAQPEKPPIYNYMIDTQGMTIQMFDGQYYFFDKNGIARLTIPKPFMIDANGAKSEAVAISITKNGNQYASQITPDNQWLTNKDRKYPVTIDPSIILAEKPLREVLEKRSLSSKTYDQGNGQLVGYFWALPVHYNDGKTWQDIDTQLTPSNDPNFTFMNTTNNTKVWFAKNIEPGKNNIKIQKDDASISFQTATNLKIGAQNITGANLHTQPAIKDNTKANRITYPAVYQDNDKHIDIAYEVLDFKIQEEITLNKFIDLSQISQNLELTNAYAKTDGKSVKFYHTQTNKFLWLIEPKMYELNHPDIVNTDLHFEINCQDGSSNIEKCDKLILTKIIDPQGKVWLSDPTRQYPIVIDPDYAANTSYASVYGLDYSSFAAARLTSTDILADEYFGVRCLGAPTYAVYRAYISFNTSSLGAGSTITGVNMKATPAEINTADGNYTIQIKKYDWSASDPIAAGNRETVYDGALAAAMDDGNFGSTAGLSVGTPATSVALNNAWVNKTGSTYYAFMTSFDSNSTIPTGGDHFKWYKPDYADVSKRPVLTVTYTTTMKFQGIKMQGILIGPPPVKGGPPSQP